MMQCSIGKILSAFCEGALQDCRLWKDADRKKIQKRVEASILRPLSVITDCCNGHFDMFSLNYESFQKIKVGCCNPLQIHSEKTFDGLRTVTSEISEKLQDSFPFVLTGRQICKTCVSLISPTMELDLMFPIVDEEYSYAKIQDLYEEAMLKHGTTLEKTLKPLQAEAIHKILLQKDLLCILATNYGKSAVMIYPSLIIAKNRGTKQICIVVSPLKTLMDDLKRKLDNWGLISLILTRENIENGDCYQIIQGASSDTAIYLISSPEILETAEARKLLIKINVTQIQIDEAHTTVTWGKEFRKSFSMLGNLRMFTECPVGIFTATFTKNMIQQIINNTGLSKTGVAIVASSPDRPEIYLELRKKENVEKDLGFLKDEYEKLGVSMPRTTMLENKGRIFKDGKLYDYISEHFSASTERVAQDRILKSFADPQGVTRVLFSTISYGMGVDNKTIDRVIIYDFDKDPLSLWQKIGRGCRGGQPGIATLYGQNENYGSIIEKGKCVRSSILSKLMGYDVDKEPQQASCDCRTASCCCLRCMCCSNCRKKCTCRLPDEFNYMEVE